MLALTQLIGFGALQAVGAPAVVTSITKVADATSTSNQITIPATVIAGDLLVLLDVARDGSDFPTSVIPSGFTQIANGGATPMRIAASYRIADADDFSDVLTGMNGDFSDDKVLVVFRGDVPFTSVSLSTPTSQFTSGDPTAQNILAAAGTPPLVVVAFYGSVGTVDPRTFSPAKDGEVASGTEAYIAWKIYNSSPANISIDMADEGLMNGLIGVFFTPSA